MVYDGVRSIIFTCYILVFDDGVAMFLFLYSFSLLYLTLHLECFEVNQICFSFVMVYFVEIDVFAFFRFLFATFVWPFLCLIFPSDVLLIFFSHMYLVLVCCFRLLVFQVSLFSIPIPKLTLIL